MPENYPVQLRVHADSRIQIGDVFVAIGELHAALAPYALQQPQPNVLIRCDQDGDYFNIGKIIYAACRAGFANDRIALMTGDDLGTLKRTP